MMWRRRPQRRGQDGFTLVEALAALAITAVIIAATGALVHNVAFGFDKGTRSVNEGERLILAVERLTDDFSSARFVQWGRRNSLELAFVGDARNDEHPATLTFVSAKSGVDTEAGDEIVNLTVEQDVDRSRLVRRRAPWFGTRTRFEEIRFSDPVVLLEGKFAIAFAFGQVTPKATISWSDAWEGQQALPRFVRLIFRDQNARENTASGTEFAIRANMPATCAQANSSCIGTDSPSDKDAR
jgi:general secretion pathway protein J